MRELGGLDLLVSNAARQQAHDSILDISSEQFDWTMKTNVYAQTKAAATNFVGSLGKQLAASDGSHATGQI